MAQYVDASTICQAERCTAVATVKCSRCKVGYCGAACQAAHWPLHKVACKEGLAHLASLADDLAAAYDSLGAEDSAFDVKYLVEELRARGVSTAGMKVRSELVAALAQYEREQMGAAPCPPMPTAGGNAAKAEWLMSTMQLGVARKASKETECSHCGKAGAAMTCTRCLAVRYCGTGCQKLHWLLHKPACARPLPASPTLLNAAALAKRRPGAPLALRGDRLFSASWGTLDPLAIALPRGVAASVATGRASAWLRGPMTASALLDVILRLERGEAMELPYAPGASDAVVGCDGCPRQGFCGVQQLSAAPDGTQRWEALWSDLFCHSGVRGEFRSADFFSPAKGSSACVSVRRQRVDRTELFKKM
jgi:hypothetical protein